MSSADRTRSLTPAPKKYDFLAPPQAAHELGRLDDLRVLAELGRGGMGVVFAASDPSLDRKVAVKVMLPHVAAEADNRKRFLAEARASARLQHEHVLAVHRVGEANGVPYVVMPLLRGESLKDRIARERPLPVGEACRIGMEIAEGLAAAHAEGLIHRDIKPANVFLDGAKARVRVLDFGLARGLGGSEMTSTGKMLGTPAYMAPEQGRDAKRVDHRADLFSLGCVLHEMLTGHRAFGGGEIIEVLMQLATHTPPACHALNPAVPVPLSELVARLLAKDPAGRPATAAEVASELERYATAPVSGPTPALPAALEGLTPPPSGSATRPAASSAWFAGQAALVLAAMALTGVAVYLVVKSDGSRPVAADTKGPPPDKVEPTPRPKPPERDRRADPPKVEPKPPEPEKKAVPPKVEPKPQPKPAPTPPEPAKMEPKPAEPKPAPVVKPDPPKPDPPKVVPKPPPPPPRKPDPLDATGDGGAAPALVKATQNDWAKYLGRPVEEEIDLGGGVTMTLVLVPPGKFVMGSPAAEKDRSRDEAERTVTLTKPYYLAKTEVTRGQFRRFVDDTGYKTEAESSGEGAYGFNPDTGEFEKNKDYTWRNVGFAQTDEHPVVNVSWNDAAAFCEWVSKKAGGGVRLPTEAEWEYACRAGTRTRYASGDDQETLARVGNVADGTAKKKFKDRTAIEAEDGYVFTCSVGQFRANALGLSDMHGNVWEWCADWYDNKYSDVDLTDPTGPATGSVRVGRGGSWFAGPLYCRSARRRRDAPVIRFSFLGFRPARSPVRSR